MSRYLMLSLICILSFIVIFATNAQERNPNNQTDQNVQSAHDEGDNDEADSFSLEKKRNRPVEKPGDYMSLFTIRHVLSNAHNKLVHFPIALAIAGFVLTLLQLRWKYFELSIPVLVAMAALGGTVAYFTGDFQADHFHDPGKGWILEFHEDLGTITTFVLWIWFIFLLAKPLKKFAIIMAIIAFLMVSVTGYIGGVLAHN